MDLNKVLMVKENKNTFICKKAVTLIEVLISLVLITTIVVASLDIQNKGLGFFQKMNSSLLESRVVATAIFENEKTLYLNDIFRFNDDLINREFKDIKLNIDHTQILMEPLDIPVVSPKLITQKSSITLDSNTTKNFYLFKVEFK